MPPNFQWGNDILQRFVRSQRGTYFPSREIPLREEMQFEITQGNATRTYITTTSCIHMLHEQFNNSQLTNRTWIIKKRYMNALAHRRQQILTRPHWALRALHTGQPQLRRPQLTFTLPFVYGTWVRTAVRSSSYLEQLQQHSNPNTWVKPCQRHN